MGTTQATSTRADAMIVLLLLYIELFTWYQHDGDENGVVAAPSSAVWFEAEGFCTSAQGHTAAVQGEQ